MNTMIKTVDVFEVVTPDNFNEERYLQENPDIRRAVESGELKSGWQHFKRHGQKEHRKQKTSEHRDAVLGLRKEKAARIRKILKTDIDIEETEDFVFDYTGTERKKMFNFDETEKVSSFFYDAVPLEIINSLPDGLILDCGAGFRTVYYENVVNYEIAPYLTTDVLGFAEDLPFEDNSFDAVFSFAVLEHVKLPFEAAKEMVRVLKPGGKMAVCAAFLQPLHGYPHHYFNMTGQGLKVLFEDVLDIEKQFINDGTGPISSLTWFLRQWVEGLPEREKKKFLKTKVADLLGQPYEYLDKGYVRELSPEKQFELASATLLLGTKR